MLFSTFLLAAIPLQEDVLLGEVQLESSPRVAVPGDIDQDGRMDALVLSSISSHVLFGGDDGATPGLQFDTAFNPDDGALGDLNGDGTIDWVVGYGGAQSVDRVDVFFNEGDSVTQGPSITGLERPGSVALGDLDLDGNLDLVTTFESFPFEGFHVFLGDGAGNFAIDTTVQFDGIKRRIELADVDNDGLLDLISANDGNGGASSGTNVRLGLGNAAFGPPTTFAPFTRMVDVAVADLDGDGELDLASLSFDDIIVHVGDGAGGFVRTAELDVTGFDGLFAHEIATGDSDGDGLHEIVVAMESSGDVVLARPLGGGTYDDPEAMILAGWATAIAIGDFVGDSAGELLNGINGVGVGFFPSDGDGGYEQFPVVETADRARDLAIADMDADGIADLVTGSAGVEVFPGTGGGAWGTPSLLLGSSMVLEVEVADLDGDGGLDIVAGTESAGVVVMLNDGNGGFAQGVTFGLAQAPTAMHLGDANGDGVSDAFIATGEDRILLLIGDGSGGWLADAIELDAFGDVMHIVLADWNADGALDLAFDMTLLGGDLVEVRYGDGNGGFAPGELLVHNLVRDLLAADLDEDGYLDLVVADNGDGIVRSWISGPEGFAEGPGVFAPFVQQVLYADLDGDGRMEMVTTSGATTRRFERAVFGFEFIGFQAAGSYLLPTFFDAGLVIADWDGNGRQDVFGMSQHLRYSANLSTLAAGLTPFGSGTPGCAGPHGLLASVEPLLGAQDFGLTCTQAPANQTGLLWISDQASAAGIPFTGVLLHALPSQGIFVLMDIESDPSGYARTLLSIPEAPALEGVTLNAQALWSAGGPWGGSASGLSTSNGLEIVIGS